MECNQQKTARRISSRRSSMPSTSADAVANCPSVKLMKPWNRRAKKQRLMVSNIFIQDEPHLVEPIEDEPNERAIVTVIGPKEKRAEGDQEAGMNDVSEGPPCAICLAPTRWFKVDYNGRQALEVNGCNACKQIGSKARVTETYIEEEDDSPLEDDFKELETEQDYIDYVKDLMQKNFGPENSEPPIQVQIDTSAVKRIEKEFDKFFPLLPNLPEGVFYNPEWQGEGEKPGW